MTSLEILLILGSVDLLHVSKVDCSDLMTNSLSALVGALLGAVSTLLADFGAVPVGGGPRGGDPTGGGPTAGVLLTGGAPTGGGPKEVCFGAGTDGTIGDIVVGAAVGVGKA